MAKMTTSSTATKGATAPVRGVADGKDNRNMAPLGLRRNCKYSLGVEYPAASRLFMAHHSGRGQLSCRLHEQRRHPAHSAIGRGHRDLHGGAHGSVGQSRVIARRIGQGRAET